MKGRIPKVLSVAVVVVMLVSAFAMAASADTASIPDAPGGVYIIRLADAPLATYQGGVEGLAGTSNRVTGASKLDANSPLSLAYRDYLAGKQAEFVTSMELAVGREVEVLFQYAVVINGMAVRLTSAEADLVARLPGVENVQPDVIRYPTTDVGPSWIGAPGVWDGSSGIGPATMGEGVIVGILDTGQNLDHPSFAEVGPSDGYEHVNPFGAGNFLGLCDTNPGDFACNDKFVGYYIYTGEYYEDTNGHGSHTASTVAGNYLEEGIVDLTPFAYSPAISGVAPHATIIGYDVCVDGGGCPGAGSIAATDQAVIDGVDVINFSIGGGTSDPWLDTGSLAFLNATEAGLVPVTSAGNNGPGAGTVGSPADAPWMLAVGAATHNRAGFNALINMTGGDTDPPGDILGKGLSEGHGPAAIVYAADFGDDGRCLNEFPAGTWTNDEIVVCDRGVIARVAKGWNVKAGGAGGLILANANPGDSLNGDIHHLPAVHITYEDGVALKTWLASGSDHMATIEGATLDFDPANGDIMAAFSSRGPLVNTAPDIIKPDVAAPGVDVLAAIHSGVPDPENATTEYSMKSGTSMASPHAAGAVALVRAMYPTWSPAEINSLLMSTATMDTVLKEDGVTPADPFDMGAGRIILGAAPGLILDETVADFEAADPALGGEPGQLNLASLGENECTGTCSWTRDVKNALDNTETWTAYAEPAPGMSISITPSEFTLNPGEVQTVEVEVGVSGLPLGEWVFARVTFDPEGMNVEPTHFPIAVRPAEEPPVIVVTPESLSSSQPPDTVEVEPLTISNEGIGDLEWEIYEDAGGALLVDWFEDWDSYPTGQDMHGVGGWKGWGDDPAYTAFTTDAQALSSPNSIDILVDADLVHEYDGYDSGFWTYTAWQYIPSDLTGESYFILLNQYDDAGNTNNWSTQVHFQSGTNLVIADGAGSGQTLPIIFDQWVEIRVEIDLVNDVQAFYYGDDLLFEGSWTDGLSGDGILDIGAVDLFANGASSVYYDDLSLVEAGAGVCDLPSDIPWVSVSPDMGTTPGGDSDIVDVTFDSTGLAQGMYEGTLCVSSNDPVTPIVPVPLTLEVTEPLPTMHVGGMEGYFGLDYMGRPVLRIHVYVEDELMAPLSDVAVDASVWVPDSGPHMRTRYTKPSGNARFHWGSLASGTWTLCVDDLTLDGYQYNPDDNVVTCMDWYH